MMNFIRKASKLYIFNDENIINVKLKKIHIANNINSHELNKILKTKLTEFYLTRYQKYLPCQ